MLSSRGVDSSELHLSSGDIRIDKPDLIMLASDAVQLLTAVRRNDNVRLFAGDRSRFDEAMETNG